MAKKLASEPASPQLATIGLACAGGVVEGAIYEIGALCALEDSIKGLDLNRLGVYVGISSGSLITSCLANGIPIRELSRALVGKAAETDMNFRPTMVFNLAFGEYFTRLSNLPHAIWKSLDFLLKRPSEWSLWGSLGGFSSVIPSGLFQNDGLERFLRNLFEKEGRTNDFRKLNTKLRVVATELDTSEVVSFGDAEWADVPISKAVQASTALPGLYTPVEISGRAYIDGVARRTVHATAALNAGAQLLFCINPIVPVNTRGENDDSERRLTDFGLPAVMSQTLRVMVASRMQTGFERYKTMYPEAQTVLIEPNIDDLEVFFSNIFSFSNRYKVCEHAYQTTRAHLRAHAEVMAPQLAAHGLALDWDVLNADVSLFAEEETEPRLPLRRQADETLTRLQDAIEALRRQVSTP